MTPFTIRVLLTGKSSGKCAKGFQKKSSASTQEPEMASKRMHLEKLIIVAVAGNVYVDAIAFDLCVIKLRQSMMWMLCNCDVVQNVCETMFLIKSVNFSISEENYFLF